MRVHQFHCAEWSPVWLAFVGGKFAVLRWFSLGDWDVYGWHSWVGICSWSKFQFCFSGSLISAWRRIVGRWVDAALLSVAMVTRFWKELFIHAALFAQVHVSLQYEWESDVKVHVITAWSVNANFWLAGKLPRLPSCALSICLLCELKSSRLIKL